jgi:hypothetical protein
MSVVERLHTKYQVTMRPFRGHASRTYCADIAKDFALACIIHEGLSGSRCVVKTGS